jgi:hypothetical protein
MPKPLQRVPVFQLLLTCEQFKAIGHIAVQWAFLESEINREIVWLLCAQSTKASVLFSIQVSLPEPLAGLSWQCKLTPPTQRD